MHNKPYTLLFYLLMYADQYVVTVIFCLFIGTCSLNAASTEESHTQLPRTLFPDDIRSQISDTLTTRNYRSYVNSIITRAQHWVHMSDEQLKLLVIGPTLPRAKHVSIQAPCPSCKKIVPLNRWSVDPFRMPWKVQCPFCKILFPTNNFYQYYKSGLNADGVFRKQTADKSLLYNTEHSDPDSPLYSFGVDDGYGYHQENTTWYFIAYYLLAGQWEYYVLNGIKTCADAYLLTGDVRYARVCLILLGRVADHFPEYDFSRQGYIYGKHGTAGYVSTWGESCSQLEDMAIAYDKVRTVFRHDPRLAQWRIHDLNQQQQRVGDNALLDIRTHIQDRIFRDALSNPHKIHSNFPHSELTAILLKAIAVDDSRITYMQLAEILNKATSVDGVTGIKGMFGYSDYVVQKTADFLEIFSRADTFFLAHVVEECPALEKMFRFHVNTLCLDRYYPNEGDSGRFAGPASGYDGVKFERQASIKPSMFSFMYRLYRHTGDVRFIQVLWNANDQKTTGLPYDLTEVNPGRMRDHIRSIIQQHGSAITQPSINLEQWCLAILRSGKGRFSRAVWMDYEADNTRNHGHLDGMNFGMFAYGISVLPDMGYPPVQYDGFWGPTANWYRSTAAHNTVVVDDTDQHVAKGVTKKWIDTPYVQVISANGNSMTSASTYERTIAAVTVDEEHFYTTDIFRVVGGHKHDKYTHSNFGSLSTNHLQLDDSPQIEHRFLRNFHTDSDVTEQWTATWRLAPKHQKPTVTDTVQLRYTGLTNSLAVTTCEAWINNGPSNTNNPGWIPCLIETRKGEPPLRSTFVSIIEPFTHAPAVVSAERLKCVRKEGCTKSADVALQITLSNGMCDIIIAADEDSITTTTSTHDVPEIICASEPTISLRGTFCVIRFDRIGNAVRVTMPDNNNVRIGDDLVLPPE